MKDFTKPGMIEAVQTISPREFSTLRLVYLLTPILMLAGAYFNVHAAETIISPYSIAGDVLSYVAWLSFALFLKKFTGTRRISRLLIPMVICNAVSLGLIQAGLFTLENADFGLKQVLFGGAGLSGIAGTVLYFISGLRMRNASDGVLRLETLGNIIMSCVGILFLINMGMRSPGPEMGDSARRILEIVSLIVRVIPYLFLFKVVSDCKKAMIS